MSVATGYRIRAWGDDPVWEQFEGTPPRAGEAVVAVEACGVGQTVLHCISGDLADDRAVLPRVPGHELVGRVVEAGTGVATELVGRRVAAYFYLSCGSCSECLAGDDNRCQRLAGYVGVHMDGGYGSLATLPARNLITMPEGLDPIAATVVPDAVATPVHICRTRARVGPEDRVAVLGAGGGVGMHLVQVARIFGAEVAGLDVSTEKLAAIEDLGAIPVRVDDFGSLDPLLFRAGRPTVVVDLVGSRHSLGWARQALASGGRLIVLTTFRDVVAEFDPRKMVMTEAAILGSRYATRREVELAGQLVASGRVRPIIGLTTEPRGAPEIHRRLRDQTLIGRAALVWS